MIPFVNRQTELTALGKSGPLTVIFGRRRIGKTALVLEWGKQHPVCYSQAIEASETIQVNQLVEDLGFLLPQGLSVSTWKEFFALLKLVQKPVCIAIDEFPYLVKTNPSLPSLLQRWLDHERPQQLSLILLGSSQSMMHHLFLQSTSPLYERADLILQLGPLSYEHYCECLTLDPLKQDTFLKFSLIGGVPRYFNWTTEVSDALELADTLFFSANSRLEAEPERLLKDEDIHGLQARSILESIGRGAHRAAEIANRLNIAHTAISKPLQILLNTSLIQRQLPFGESTRSTKRTLYTLADPALRFWYSIYSPHRSRWHLYSREEKLKLLHEHASSVLEDTYRNLFPDAERYWESNLEFDCVRFDPQNRNALIVSEIKFAQLNNLKRQEIGNKIKVLFEQSQLAGKYQLSRTEVLDLEDVLKQISRKNAFH